MVTCHRFVDDALRFTPEDIDALQLPQNESENRDIINHRQHYQFGAFDHRPGSRTAFGLCAQRSLWLSLSSAALSVSTSSGLRPP